MTRDLVHLQCDCGWERYAPVGSGFSALLTLGSRGHVDHVITPPVEVLPGGASLPGASPGV